MTKVSEVMTRDVPKVDYSSTVLDACKTILDKNFTGAIVLRRGKVVGMLTERALLRRFVPLDRKASLVEVHEIMAPVVRIDSEASTLEAAKKLLGIGYTRMCVFRKDEFVGWVTLTDLARHIPRRSLIRTLLGNNKPEEVWCPSCKDGILEQVLDANGEVSSWSCPKCGYIIG